MAGYAIVDEITGTVVNTVEWDGKSAWVPPDGTRVEEFNPAVHEQRVPEPTATASLQLRSKDGTVWDISVRDDGTLAVTAV